MSLATRVLGVLLCGSMWIGCANEGPDSEGPLRSTAGSTAPTGAAGAPALSNGPSATTPATSGLGQTSGSSNDSGRGASTPATAAPTPAANGGSGGSASSAAPAANSGGAGAAAPATPPSSGGAGSSTPPASGGAAGAAPLPDLTDVLPPLSTPETRIPSPNNPAECPATAPENPVGDCLGLPVYLECEYGTYYCVCDWYHWLCAG
jgi:hypothetical protein